MTKNTLLDPGRDGGETDIFPGNQLDKIYQKLLKCHILWTTNSVSSNLSQGNNYQCAQRLRDKNIHCNIVQTKKKWEEI